MNSNNNQGCLYGGGAPGRGATSEVMLAHFEELVNRNMAFWFLNAEGLEWVLLNS